MIDDNGIKAYAKVNLHLEVLDKREDGYHNIFSVMAAVDLFDLLKLECLDAVRMPGESIFRIKNLGGYYGRITDSIDQADNLVIRAAKAYFDASCGSGRAFFGIEKNIPSGAGLGGGSSDAAAALRILNDRLGWMDDDGLMRTAASIGADVPFCLKGGLAFCEGIGEIVTPIKSRIGHHLVIAETGIHINTASAYRALGRGFGSQSIKEPLEKKMSRISVVFEKGDLSAFREMFKNDFEVPAFKEHPILRDIKEGFYKSGAVYSTMTGSGSAMIGLFDDLSRAEKYRKSLDVKGMRVILARFI
ncbi:MAG: 4-(cytidine 5'-diphospho)-2-C-methyl-D-erythritol kinase [Spirochaetes bacterium]|nr:4-(cytidine 5'-diphospho)-2-C-methyl-D-erythritol kinase [Spirochaetota bacterium]